METTDGHVGLRWALVLLLCASVVAFVGTVAAGPHGVELRALRAREVLLETRLSDLCTVHGWALASDAPPDWPPAEMYQMYSELKRVRARIGRLDAGSSVVTQSEDRACRPPHPGRGG